MEFFIKYFSFLKYIPHQYSPGLSMRQKRQYISLYNEKKKALVLFYCDLCISCGSRLNSTIKFSLWVFLWRIFFVMGNILLIGVDVIKPNGILLLPEGKISKWRMCQSHSCFLLLLGQWIKLDKFKLSSKPLFLKERSQISLHLFPSLLWESPLKTVYMQDGRTLF